MRGMGNNSKMRTIAGHGLQRTRSAEALESCRRDRRFVFQDASSMNYCKRTLGVVMRSTGHGLTGVMDEDVHDSRTAAMERVNMMHWQSCLASDRSILMRSGQDWRLCSRTLALSKIAKGAWCCPNIYCARTRKCGG